MASKRFYDKVKGSGVMMALDPSPNATGIVVVDFRKLGMHATDPIHMTTIRQGSSSASLDDKATEAMARIYRMIRKFDVERLVCERVGSVGHGRSNPNFYTNAAMIKMEGDAQLIAAILGIPLKLYTPKQWKAAYGIRGDDQKQQARNMATEYSGLHYLTFDEHTAEAYLIALYDVRHHAIAETEQVRLL
jgi:Holliday junction resolvasome RuvABC endonuclease subunit